MKKISMLIFFIFILILVFFNSTLVVDSVIFAFKVCIFNLFPTMIPFLILSSLLANYGFIEYLALLLKPIFNKVFHLNSYCSYIFVLSFLSGCPANAKYINDLLNNNKINVDEANHILFFSNFVNPLFLIATLGTIFLKNTKYGLIILISELIASIIIGIIYRGNSKINTDIVLDTKEALPLIKCLKESIFSTFKTCLLVMGIIISFVTLCNLIFDFTHLNNILTGFIELTSGLKYISLSTLNTKLKTVVSTFFIGFGGISIHAQIFSILDNKKIRYLPYFKVRLLQAIISSLITLIILIWL